MSEVEVKRLNWGCGDWTPKGWINSDIKDGYGVDLPCDIRKGGLPLENDSIDYAVSIHALPEFFLNEIVPVLEELRRVLKPAGWIRLGLPDLIKGVEAYQRGDTDYFLIPDKDAKSIGAKLVWQLNWYGYSKTLFTREFIEEMLLKAGFARVHHCAFQESQAPWPEIVTLDNREQESLFVEAVK